MRTHGWGGSAPASDEEAVARILAAASRAIDERGADISIADVARTLGVTRQTVYRYFPSTDALLQAAAVRSANEYLERLAGHLAGVNDPVEAVVEGIATTLEWLPSDKHMGLLLGPHRAGTFTADVTSDLAVQFADHAQPLRRGLAGCRLHRRRPRRARRVPAADHPVVRRRPRTTASDKGRTPPISAPVGWPRARRGTRRQLNRHDVGRTGPHPTPIAVYRHQRRGIEGVRREATERLGRNAAL
jgi:AcrR family transcriptional regulator